MSVHCFHSQTEFPDLEALQQERARRFRATKKAEKRSEFLNEKAATKERKDQAELRSYTTIMNKDNMKSNANAAAEEDFM